MFRVAAALVAVAATCAAQLSAVAAPTASAGACGDLKFDMPHGPRVMPAGQDRPLTVTFTAERACTFDVYLLGLERDSGIAISPAHPVRISTPATHTWRIAGTKPTKDALVARLNGRDRTPFVLGVRLPDVEVHKPKARSR